MEDVRFSMGHSHAHRTSMAGRRLVFLVIITVAFVVGEAVAGYFSNSLALLSDAGHNLADALALVLSFYALWIAHRPSSANRSYGYHTFGILVPPFHPLPPLAFPLLFFLHALS